MVQKVRKIVKLFRRFPVKNDDHLQRLFVSNGSDEVVSNEEQEMTTSNNGQETQTQMTLAQELYAFVADDKNEEEQ